MTFNPRTFDRAQDAYNLARKIPVQQKVMVFIVPSKVKLGVVKTEVRFPYKGKISNIYATCGSVGTTNTVIQVERCSQSDYDISPVWKSIFSTNLTLDANEKSTNTSEIAYVLDDDSINPNDHFRLNVVGLGEGVEDITLEVVVDI